MTNEEADFAVKLLKRFVYNVNACWDINHVEILVEFCRNKDLTDYKIIQEFSSMLNYLVEEKMITLEDATAYRLMV